MYVQFTSCVYGVFPINKNEFSELHIIYYLKQNTNNTLNMFFIITDQKIKPFNFWIEVESKKSS